MKQIPKEEILAAIEREHGLLLQYLATLNEAEMQEPGVRPTPPPGQSCKEMLAHLTAWEQRMIALIRAILSDAPLPVYPTAPKFNTQIFYASKDRPLTEIWTEFESSYAEALALVRQLSEEELAKNGVWQLVGYNTYNHYKWASTALRQWLRACGKLPAGRTKAPTGASSEAACR